MKINLQSLETYLKWVFITLNILFTFIAFCLSELNDAQMVAQSQAGAALKTSLLCIQGCSDIQYVQVSRYNSVLLKLYLYSSHLFSQI